MKTFFSKALTLAITAVLSLPLLSSCGSAVGVSSIKGREQYALYNCTVIDGTGNGQIDDAVILVKGDRIEKIGKKSEVGLPKGYSRCNLKGSYVLPGFINAHVHYAYDRKKLSDWLKGGVTTVRDLNPFNVSDPISSRDRLNQDNSIARLVSSTPMLTAPDGYGSLFVSSPQDARENVHKLIEQDYDVVKLAVEDYINRSKYSVLKSEEVQAISEAAKEKGKWTVAHISRARNLNAALDCGINEISHMVIDEKVETSIIRRMVEQDIYWTPTLELWNGISKKFGMPYKAIAIDNLSSFYKAGGKIVLGTDFGGFNTSFDTGFPITEANLMKDAGMSNMDIIVAGTRNAAMVCGLQDELGTLEQGKIADMIIFEESPLENLELMAQPKAVIHNGILSFTDDK